MAPPDRSEDFRRGTAALRRTADATGAPGTRAALAAAGVGGAAAKTALAMRGDTPTVPDAITVKVTCEQCGHKLGQKIEKIVKGQIGAVEPGQTYA